MAAKGWGSVGMAVVGQSSKSSVNLPSRRDGGIIGAPGRFSEWDPQEWTPPVSLPTAPAHPSLRHGLAMPWGVLGRSRSRACMREAEAAAPWARAPSPSFSLLL
ncbi:hypothetical protein E2562_008563 [Oryza meyeriana var. granulata]|uniref:Uncharacterized protein n=1 Tax=Oryza meyeriana var. granulata TaxID=110450 RepID=A0A6G1C608_9ORYZ|nr:hypothetical protein E2562_008563 [Oryza meyeriana var. granulata]